MGGRSPKFNESDPCWMRLDELTARFGIKHAQMQRVRKQLRNAFEHTPTKPGKPVWVYFPQWTEAYYRLKTPAVPMGVGDDDAVYKRVRRQREEFKFAVEKREYVHIEEVNTILDMAAAAVRSTLDASNDRAFVDALSDRLQRAEKEARNALTHVNGNGSPPKRSGGRS